MARILPFNAILYRRPENGDITDLVSPPYDVINGTQRAAYLKREDHNVVRLILPDNPGPAGYADAGARLQTWLSEKVLVESAQPAMYAWEQNFVHDGHEFTRRALVARVEAGPYGKGKVLGHEKTHASIKEDRLALFRAMEIQFSQMFGVFRDAENAVRDILAGAATGEPILTAKADDGHESRLYAIEDAITLRALQTALADSSIVMADGHHRYETTVAYFEERGAPGAALMTLVPEGDPGLLVLPTHRTVNMRLDISDFMHGLGADYVIASHRMDEWPQLHERQLAADGPELLAIAPALGATLRLAPTPAHSAGASLQGAVGLLHNDCLPRLAAAAKIELPTSFEYHHEAPQAVEAADREHGWAFLLPPTAVGQLIKVAEAGEFLPAKSTFFVPKFLSGFINARLDTV